jgi:hypothetical protein
VAAHDVTGTVRLAVVIHALALVRLGTCMLQVQSREKQDREEFSVPRSHADTTKHRLEQNEQYIGPK